MRNHHSSPLILPGDDATSHAPNHDDMAAMAMPSPAIAQDMVIDAMETIETYAREKPWNFGLIALGVGFVLGWKMKFF